MFNPLPRLVYQSSGSGTPLLITMSRPDSGAMRLADISPASTGRSRRNPRTCPPAVRKQLKQIALEEDRTVQDCLAEALNELFAAEGPAGDRVA